MQCTRHSQTNYMQSLQIMNIKPADRRPRFLFSARLLNVFLDVACARKMKLRIIGAAAWAMSACHARASPKAKRLRAARARGTAIQDHATPPFIKPK